MTLKDDLIAAKALIDTPEKWRKDDKEAYTACCAVIAANRACEYADKATDALYAVLPAEWREGGENAAAGEEDPGPLIGEYNDAPNTTHADIMALFDRAIEAAE